MFSSGEGVNVVLSPMQVQIVIRAIINSALVLSDTDSISIKSIVHKKKSVRRSCMQIKVLSNKTDLQVNLLSLSLAKYVIDLSWFSK
jgi:hypothetical protein